NMRRPAPMTVALGRMLGLKIRVGDRASMQSDMQLQGFWRYFKCPAQDNVPLGSTQRGEDGWEAPLEYLSYCFNEAVLGRRPWRDTPRGNSARVHRSAIVILFGDGLPRADGSAWMTLPEGSSDLTMYDYYLMTQASYRNIDLKRHRGRMNIVFC